jgi:hypothetical protein
MSFWRNDLRLWAQEHTIRAGVDHANEIFMVPSRNVDSFLTGSALHFDLRIDNHAFEKKLLAVRTSIFLQATHRRGISIRSSMHMYTQHVVDKT